MNPNPLPANFTISNVNGDVRLAEEEVDQEPITNGVGQQRQITSLMAIGRGPVANDSTLPLLYIAQTPSLKNQEGEEDHHHQRHPFNSAQGMRAERQQLNAASFNHQQLPGPRQSSNNPGQDLADLPVTTFDAPDGFHTAAASDVPDNHPTAQAPVRPVKRGKVTKNAIVTPVPASIYQPDPRYDTPSKCREFLATMARSDCHIVQIPDEDVFLTKQNTDNCIKLIFDAILARPDPTPAFNNVSADGITKYQQTQAQTFEEVKNLMRTVADQRCAQAQATLLYHTALDIHENGVKPEVYRDYRNHLGKSTKTEITKCQVECVKFSKRLEYIAKAIQSNKLIAMELLNGHVSKHFVPLALNPRARLKSKGDYLKSNRTRQAVNDDVRARKDTMPKPHKKANLSKKRRRAVEVEPDGQTLNPSDEMNEADGFDAALGLQEAEYGKTVAAPAGPAPLTSVRAPKRPRGMQAADLQSGDVQSDGNYQTQWDSTPSMNNDTPNASFNYDSTLPSIADPNLSSNLALNAFNQNNVSGGPATSNFQSSAMGLHHFGPMAMTNHSIPSGQYMGNYNHGATGNINSRHGVPSLPSSTAQEHQSFGQVSGTYQSVPRNVGNNDSHGAMSQVDMVNTAARLPSSAAPEQQPDPSDVDPNELHYSTFGHITNAEHQFMGLHTLLDQFNEGDGVVPGADFNPRF